MEKGKLEPIACDFVELAKEANQAAGLDTLLATVFGILFIEPGEMSMDDLAKKSGYSLASISQKLKLILPFGIIKKRTKPGSKKIYLSVEKDLFSIWHKQIKDTYAKKAELAKSMTPIILDKYRNSKKTERESKMYKIIENYYDQVIEFDDFIQSILIKLKEKNNGK